MADTLEKDLIEQPEIDYIECFNSSDPKAYLISHRDTHIIDWNHITEKYKLDPSFMTDFDSKLNWKKIPIAQNNLSVDFIITNQKHNIDNSAVAKWQKLDENKINELKNIIDFDVIGAHQNISEEFINTNIDKFKDLNILIINSNNLSLDFININIDKLDLNLVARWQYLDHDFIVNNITKLDIKTILTYQELELETINFILNYDNNINYYDLIWQYQNVDWEFIVNNITKVNYFLISKYQKIDFQDNNIYNNFIIPNILNKKLNIKYLLEFQNITEEIILTWLDKDHPINNILDYENYFINLVDFNIISKSIDLSIEFVNEYKTKINYKNINLYNSRIISLKDFLIINNKLSIDDIKFNNKIDYETKLNNFNITPKIIIKDDLYITEDIFYYRNSQFKTKEECINYFKKMFRVKKKKQQEYLNKIEEINNAYYS